MSLAWSVARGDTRIGPTPLALTPLLSSALLCSAPRSSFIVLSILTAPTPQLKSEFDSSHLGSFALPLFSMSCPFGFTGLRAAQAMEQAQAARLDGQPQPDNGTNLPTGGASPNRSPSLSPSVASPPTAPLGLFTGGLRTSLGVENAHPLAVWMKEMKARGELKGVDIDEEFRALSQPPIGGDDDLIRQQQDKNWKEKRERPPVEFSSTTSNNNNNNNTNSPTQPGTAIPNGSNPAEWYPGVFSGKIDHNSHAGQSPMVKYDQEITYWNYIFPDVLTSLQNGRQGKGLNHHDEVRKQEK